MGEIFVRESALGPIVFAGELTETAVSDQTDLEYLHRYIVAREFCRDKDVLDLTAGASDGAALLSQVARSVRAAGGNRSLPLAAASVDVVVAFGPIVPAREQEALLSEVRRVLRPGGLVVIGAPDEEVDSSDMRAPTRGNLADLAGRFFRHRALLLQRKLTGSALLPATAGTGPGAPFMTFERRRLGLPRARYAVLVASDAPVAVGGSLCPGTNVRLCRTLAQNAFEIALLSPATVSGHLTLDQVIPAQFVG